MLPILPDPPSRDDPNSFSDRADAFLAALPAWTDAANALEQSLQLVATTGTSTTSLTIGTGSKTLTTQLGKAWAVGSFVYVVLAASVANMMIGQVTAYNSVTGSLAVSVVTASGSGTIASWVIGLSAPLGSSASYSGAVTAAVLAVDGNFYSALVSGNPVIYVDTNDYIWYDRTNNKMGFSVGGTDRFTVDAADGPQRTTDASTSNGLVRKAQMDAAVSKAPSVAGASRNLKVSTTGTSASISLSCDALVVEDSSGACKTLKSISLGSFASSGSGINGLDTGSLAANTWYNIFVVHDGTNTAGIISTSSTTPSGTGAYTYKAWVGAMKTDGSVNKFPLAMKQEGALVHYTVSSASNVAALPALCSGAQGTYGSAFGAPVSVSGVLPPAAVKIKLLLESTSTASCSIAVSPNSSYSPAVNVSNQPPLNNGFVGSPPGVAGDLMLEGANIYVVSQVNTVLKCIGWEYSR